MLWEPDRGCPDHPQRRREFVAWHGQGSPSHHAALAPGSEVSLFIGNETKTGGSAVVFWAFGVPVLGCAFSGTAPGPGALYRYWTIVFVAWLFFLMPFIHTAPGPGARYKYWTIVFVPLLFLVVEGMQQQQQQLQQQQQQQVMNGIGGLGACS